MGLFDKDKKAKEDAERKARLAEQKADSAKDRAKRAQRRAERAEKELKAMKDDKKRKEFFGRKGAKAKAGKSSIGMGGIPKREAEIIEEYTVKKGDTLSQIAKKYYGSGSAKYYNLIQSANKDIIKDVNVIKPGQVFKIPALPKGF